MFIRGYTYITIVYYFVNLLEEYVPHEVGNKLHTISSFFF